jgi:hypothetical protein
MARLLRQGESGQRHRVAAFRQEQQEPSPRASAGLLGSRDLDGVGWRFWPGGYSRHRARKSLPDASFRSRDASVHASDTGHSA